MNLTGLTSPNHVVLLVLTDALLAVWHRDADVGVLSPVRHQVLRLLMATRSSGLFTRTHSADKQGNLIYIHNYH